MRDKIYYDIKTSTYSYTLWNIKFYFSSKFYLHKFKNEIENYISKENQKLKIKFKLEINAEKMLAIAYYKKVEKRGFFIIDNTKEKEIKESEVFTLEF